MHDSAVLATQEKISKPAVPTRRLPLGSDPIKLRLGIRNVSRNVACRRGIGAMVVRLQSAGNRNGSWHFR
ncbi:hypothetical protein O1611_g2225 [Lasiodiplodia mahajangana]|uniref:Uncharacterized protein n=1 Tax=Lasiodiplodia mahajangana TaxID=1108764 RepID=A0ACC2JV65_9PEZI|nr:hypothetical protein O1611_g2225 [Lasiodiplodia mahajangana]